MGNGLVQIQSRRAVMGCDVMTLLVKGEDIREAI